MTKARMAMLAAENKKLEQAGLFRPETIHPDHVVDFTSQDYLGLARHERVLGAARAALDKSRPRARLVARAHRARARSTASSSRRSRAFSRSPMRSCSARATSQTSASTRRCSTAATACSAMRSFTRAPPRACGCRRPPRSRSATTTPMISRTNCGDLGSARFRAIVTDGVFPFDGRVAELDGICALAEKYDAMVVLDDSLGIGVLGETGRGTRELRGVIPRIDVVTGTFGKALGGAGGGYIAGKREVISWLRQKATPYLFSTALSPPLAAAAHAAVELLERGEAPLATLRSRVATMKKELELRGYKVLGRTSVARRARRRCRRVAEARQPALRARHPCERSLLSRRAGRPGADPARAQRTAQRPGHDSRDQRLRARGACARSDLMIELRCTLDRSRIPPDVATEVGCQLELRPSEMAAVAGQVALTTNLCLVLDCSASMLGAKVKAAIQAAKLIVNTIDARRRISVVGFATSHWVVVDNASPEETGRDVINGQIERLQDMIKGSTNLGEGIRRGIKIVQRHQADASVLVVLTDGIADSQADAEQASAEANEAGVQVFAVGIGEAFRADDLLKVVAPSGGTLLGERAADRLEAAFAELLKRIESFVATRVQLAVSPAPGVMLGAMYKTSPERMFIGDNVDRMIVGNLERGIVYSFHAGLTPPCGGSGRGRDRARDAALRHPVEQSAQRDDGDLDPCRV